MKYLLAFSIAFVTFTTSAQEAGAPLLFKEWKNQQVLDAQNQVLRASTRVNQLLTGKPPTTPKKSTRLPNDKVRASAEDEAVAADRELRRAQEGLATATNLTFGNYIDVYLPLLKNDAVALQKLADKLSKDELAEIFRALMKAPRDLDGRRAPAKPATLAARVPARD